MVREGKWRGREKEGDRVGEREGRKKKLHSGLPAVVQHSSNIDSVLLFFFCFFSSSSPPSLPPLPPPPSFDSLSHSLRGSCAELVDLNQYLASALPNIFSSLSRFPLCFLFVCFFCRLFFFASEQRDFVFKIFKPVLLFKFYLVFLSLLEILKPFLFTFFGSIFFQTFLGRTFLLSPSLVLLSTSPSSSSCYSTSCVTVLVLHPPPTPLLACLLIQVFFSRCFYWTISLLFFSSLIFSNFFFFFLLPFLFSNIISAFACWSYCCTLSKPVAKWFTFGFLCNRQGEFMMREQNG